ncbi:uncharacterized protein LOC108199184 [Daucus carota subsp. sativus]|uniref:uncharacterized protein LOC108199184 n=1 Tax=Daucus carota subsp. sativus TaxID=79200 RepID=UPI0007EFA296|nr:PREDICTED: uncharacterized protein LOC108199184 [Daucus carota subsp. sativus]
MLKRYQASLNCTYCKEKGHNTRTCKAKMVDDANKGEQGGASSKEPKKCGICKGTGHNARSCKQKNVEVKKGQDDTSTRPNPENATAPNDAPQQQADWGITAPTELPDTTHGGIRKPYKPPSRNVLGVHSVPGQPFTTSRNLEAARRRMEKNVGKKAS